MNDREKNLLAQKSVERRDRGCRHRDRQETMNASLPDDLTLRIFGFCSAKCLLTAEVASRALRDLRWHKTNDAHWCGLLRARWPREGPALCSLRQRATARQLFRAFATKRDARTQIMRRPERVVDTDDSDEEEKFRIWGEDQANDDPDRLAFLVCVGRFAGLASWMQVPADAPYSIALKPGLAWKPTDAETSFNIEIPQDVHMLSRAQIIEEHEGTLREAYNYAAELLYLRRFDETKSVICKMMPVARRVLGDSHEITLLMRWTYATALYEDDAATLDDQREAVATLADAERIARRVLGGAHPHTVDMEQSLRKARAALRARETPATE